MVARESKNVSIVEKFGCHKRAERLIVRRTLGVRLRCMSPFLALSGDLKNIRSAIAIGCKADIAVQARKPVGTPPGGFLVPCREAQVRA